jgi:4,5-dihydroxyphthalate decarboxylase
VLAEEYGVDLDSITWVVDDDDHIEGRTPDNVQRVEDSLSALLDRAAIDAAFTGNAGTGRAGAPRPGWAEPANGDGSPYPLFADAAVLERDWYLRTGIYPLHSVIVLRRELVDVDPDLPSALYAAFADSKRRQLAADPDWNDMPRLGRQTEQVGGDPIPYGQACNAASLAALVRFSRDQHLVEGDLDLFAAGHYPDC